MFDENYRILVIDDVPSIHEDFRKILTPSGNVTSARLDEMNEMLTGKLTTKKLLPPFQIDSAFQGSEGLQKVSEALDNNKPYALAFVDVQMPPGKDGIETIGEIWKIDPHIQTVVCTAYAKYSWEDIMARFGESDRLFILKKPFDRIEIIQMACALARKWNLDHAITHHMRKPKTKGTDLARSVEEMQDAVESLVALNEKLKNRPPLKN